MRWLLLACLLLGPLVASRGGVGAPGDLVWSDRFDRAGQDDRFHAVAIAGPRAFAVGRTEGGNADGLVRCYDVRSGAPCWEDFYDLAGGEDEALAVAAEGRRVFVAGRSASLSGDTDFLVRAYDAHTGLLLWQDVFDPAGSDDRATAVAARSGTVFVAGRTGAPFAYERIVVRAYDAKTGALRWNNVYEPPGEFVLVDAVQVSGRWVAVVGGAETEAAEDDFLLHVIDRRSGATLFDDLVNGARDDNDRARGVAVGGGRAFAVGWLDNLVPGGEGSLDLAVRAYDLAKGRLLWEDVFDGMQEHEAAHAVALDGGRLLVAGAAGESSAAADLLVRCYHASSGRLLWEDRVDLAGGLDEARAVAAAGGAFLVAGHATDAAGAQQTLVRAYRAASGALLFEDLFEGGLEADYEVSVAASGSRGVVAAAVVDLSQADPGLIADAVIRAYSLR